MVNSILITVRTSSTRLPRKAILDINGKPTIQYLIENIKKSKKDGRCAAINSSGERCSNEAVAGGFCTIHEKKEQRR